MPCGIVDEENVRCTLPFAVRIKRVTSSSYHRSQAGGDGGAREGRDESIQIKMDNGPESSGRRTQFSRVWCSWKK